MNIDTTIKDGALSIILEGRLDSTTAEELEETINSKLTNDISSLNINLENVDFISSKGLRVLVGAYKSLNGKEVTLIGPNPSIVEVLRLSGLLKIFKIS